MEEEKKLKRKRSPVLWAAYVLLALLVVLAVYLVAMKALGKIPSVFGYSVLRVVSPSMEDTIPTGEYILIKKTDPASVKEGDIITFYSTDPAIYMQANTHRVVAVEQGESGLLFTTKGDHNPVEDDVKVPQANLIGRYQTSVPVLTKIGGVFQNKTIFLLLVLIPAALFLISELVNVARVAHSFDSEDEKADFLENEKARLKAKEEKHAQNQTKK